MKTLVNMRILGSVLVVIGYFTLLHIHTQVGVWMHLTGDVVSLPFFLRTKCYDIIVLVVLLSSTSISKLMAQ